MDIKCEQTIYEQFLYGQIACSSALRDQFSGISYKPSLIHDLTNELGERGCLVGLSFCFIFNSSCCEVYLNFISIIYPVSVWALQNRDSYIYRFLKKILAKDFAITQATFDPFRARGACSREDPQPKLLPATTISLS